MISLPGRQQGALERIERTLAAEDPRLELRFAAFTRLTRHEAMPVTEQVPGHVQRFLRRVLVLPLMMVSLAALLAASWLIPGSHACPTGQIAAARAMPPAIHAARCQPEPGIKPETIPMH